MSYLEEFQKQGRALRARPKVKVRVIDFDDIEKFHEVESRSKRRKNDSKEIQKQLQESFEDF